jgi:protein-ribulosamine 3-kinase
MTGGSSLPRSASASSSSAAPGRAGRGGCSSRASACASACRSCWPTGAGSPALLHGDLWAGNRAADAAGQPVVFDPAVHYGDPECDLAMTRLFGGFAPEFYAAYEAIIPPAPGRALRERLYQLYHVLNHANLFGGGYVAQAGRLVDQLGSG